MPHDPDEAAVEAVAQAIYACEGGDLKYTPPTVRQQMIAAARAAIRAYLAHREAAGFVERPTQAWLSSYDADGDVLYLRSADAPPVERRIEADHGVIVGLGKEGRVVGITVLDAEHGLAASQDPEAGNAEPAREGRE